MTANDAARSLARHPDRSIDDKFERVVAERDDLAGALVDAERERDKAEAERDRALRLAALTAEQEAANAQIIVDTRAERDALMPVVEAAKAWRAQFEKPADSKPPRMRALIAAVDALTDAGGA